MFTSGDSYFAPIIALAPRVDALYVESIRLARREIAKLEADAEAGDGHGHEARDGIIASGFLVNQISAREDFLGEAIVLLSEYGMELDAKRLLARARASYPNTPAFTLAYDEFIIRDLTNRFSDPGMFDTQIGTSQIIEGAWTRAFVALALGEDERYRALDRLANATRIRWERFLATLDPVHAQRLRVPYERVRGRAAYRAAQTLPAGLRGMLAQRTGIPLAQLETPPARIPLPPPRNR